MLEDWYRGFRQWEKCDGDLIAVRPLVAEMIAAGVVAAGSVDAYWAGGGSQRSWDVRGDGVLVDVKHAWVHRAGVLGVPPPPAKTRQYDPQKVHEIALVVLEAEVDIDHEYWADGAVTFSVRARPRAVFRIPVADMNRVMRQDGRSRGRWLVDLHDIASFLVRGSVLALDGADSLAQDEDLAGSEG
ncbi:hypothetical protein DRA43_02490 [Micromonospora provocatoris]|nr:hypothetical protein DRA43_02490 [Micromonospora provocatoris]